MDRFQPFQKHSLVFLYVITIIHFLLNYLVIPELKYFYLLELAFIYFVIVRFDFKFSFIFLIYLLFIDGQGRIIWQYNPLIRNVFDLGCLLAIFKSISLKEMKYPINKVPFAISFAIIFHIAWYFLQLFNYESVGFIGVLAASKIYVFPFLLFVFLLNNPIKEDSIYTKSAVKFFIFLVIMECALIFFQMSMREEILIGLSDYYWKPIKDAFYGIAFRPFGTSHLPGGVSVYFALSVGLYFFKKKKNKLLESATLIAILLSFVALFMMQVRVSMLKFVLFLIMFFFIRLVAFPREKGIFIKCLIGSSFFVGLVIFAINKDYNAESSIDLSHSISRYEALVERTNIGEYRTPFRKFFDIAAEKLRAAPLGVGPGRTGAANSISMNYIKNDPIFGKDFIWTHDNLFISLIIDLGIGMIFYCFIIISIPFILFFNALRPINRSMKNTPLLVCAILTTIMLLGSWGAVSIPYNPESFFFWFYAANGLNYMTIHKENQNVDAIS